MVQFQFHRSQPCSGWCGAAFSVLSLGKQEAAFTAFPGCFMEMQGGAEEKRLPQLSFPGTVRCSGMANAMCGDPAPAAPCLPLPLWI